MFSTRAGRRALSQAGRLLLCAGGLMLIVHCSKHAPRQRPKLQVITIAALKFRPDSASIATGDTVEWINRDIVPHTSTASSADWNSGVLQPNESWRTVIEIPGRKPYGCLLHTTMKAVLVVR